FGAINIRPDFSIVELPANLDSAVLDKLRDTRISGRLIEIKPDRGPRGGARRDGDRYERRDRPSYADRGPRDDRPRRDGDDRPPRVGRPRPAGRPPPPSRRRPPASQAPPQGLIRARTPLALQFPAHATASYPGSGSATLTLQLPARAAEIAAARAEKCSANGS